MRTKTIFVVTFLLLNFMSLSAQILHIDSNYVFSTAKIQCSNVKNANCEIIVPFYYLNSWSPICDTYYRQVSNSNENCFRNLDHHRECTNDWCFEQGYHNALTCDDAIWLEGNQIVFNDTTTLGLVEYYLYFSSEIYNLPEFKSKEVLKNSASKYFNNKLKKGDSKNGSIEGKGTLLARISGTNRSGQFNWYIVLINGEFHEGLPKGSYQMLTCYNDREWFPFLRDLNNLRSNGLMNKINEFINGGKENYSFEVRNRTRFESLTTNLNDYTKMETDALFYKLKFDNKDTFTCHIRLKYDVSSTSFFNVLINEKKEKLRREELVQIRRKAEYEKNTKGSNEKVATERANTEKEFNNFLKEYKIAANKGKSNLDLFYFYKRTKKYQCSFCGENKEFIYYLSDPNNKLTYYPDKVIEVIENNFAEFEFLLNHESLILNGCLSNLSRTGEHKLNLISDIKADKQPYSAEELDAIFKDYLSKKFKE